MHEFDVLLFIIKQNNFFFHILASVLQLKVIDLIYLVRTMKKTLCVLYMNRERQIHHISVY